MKKPSWSSVLKFINNFIIFFILVAFIITCCTMLFVTILANSLEIDLTDENISLAAKATFLNVILLTVIFTVIDTIRRQITVHRPVRKITESAKKITQGDFSVRITPESRLGRDDTFNQIIDCFNTMAAELGSVESLRSDFIANVSHELKTPLAVIHNYGILLQDPELNEEERIKYAKGVTEASKRLADMVTNILKLNRLENGQIFPATNKFDLSEQLCLCILQFENVWEEKNIEIETNIPDNIMIKSDSELLFLVWNNLLSNAFKFTPEGGKVKISLSLQGNFAVVTVQDTGCGMDPSVGARIFEKFYQADPSHLSEGNGLGLALVKRVIDITKGEIEVESSPGNGSIFTVKIERNCNEF